MHKVGFTDFSRKPVRQFVPGIISLLVILPFLMTCASSDEVKSTQTKTPEPNVDLSVAMVLPSANTLAFSMANLSNKAIPDRGISTSPCKLVFIKPNDETVEFQSHVGPMGIGPEPVIKPGETKRWDVDISEYFGRRMTEKGIYRLIWVYTQWISEDQTMQVKSNEFLILKNEDSPRFNPETGQPE